MRILAPFLLVATPALADSHLTADPASFSWIGAGVLCAAESSTREAAPDTRLGFIDLVEGEITLGLDTATIPAIPGLSFGVVADVAEGAGRFGVTIVVTHPPMGTDGTVRESWVTDFVSGESTANFFRFDLPEERVPGDWTLQAEQDGQVFYTARFRVVDPASLPGFSDPCPGPVPVS